MRPCLTLLSGCSEGERRDPVTHWDITHIHVHKFMHAHTQTDAHTFGPTLLHTHTNTRKVWISIFFISQFPTHCTLLLQLHKTGCSCSTKSWQNVLILNSSPQNITAFSISYLFGGWLGDAGFVFVKRLWQRWWTFLSSIVSFTAIKHPLSTTFSLQNLYHMAHYYVVEPSCPCSFLLYIILCKYIDSNGKNESNSLNVCTYLDNKAVFG